MGGHPETHTPGPVQSPKIEPQPRNEAWSAKRKSGPSRPDPFLWLLPIARGMPQQREPEVSSGWVEVFVNSCEAVESADVVSSLIQGHSVIVLHGVATAAECERIQAQAVAFQPLELDPVAELQTASRCLRRSILDICDEEGLALCDRILMRAVRSLPAGILSSALGQDLAVSVADASSLLDHQGIEFSNGEPGTARAYRATRDPGGPHHQPMSMCAELLCLCPRCSMCRPRSDQPL